MHGYIDSFPVPIHLDRITHSTKQQQKGKGKQDNSKPAGETYDVVAEWSAQERDTVQRKLQLAASRKHEQFTAN